MQQLRVHIARLKEGYLSAIQAGLEDVGFARVVKPGDTVFLKPNLTFPHYRKGVMTSPECVEAAIVALKQCTDKIIIGEADSGGYNPFSIDEVLARTGIEDIGRKYGVRVVNLTHLPHRTLVIACNGRILQCPFPVLLDEVDCSITLPVPKIHMNTGVSMAIKNQWGCIPVPSARLTLHPFFPKVIFEVNEAMKTRFAIVDGQYGLNRSGPMLGDPVPLNWLMVANNIYAADLIGCELMQINPSTVYYLRYLKDREGVIPSREEIVCNCDPREYQTVQFRLHREWTDYLSLAAFRSSFISYLAYRSPVADLLHRILYLFREPFYNYSSPSQTAPVLRAEADESKEASRSAHT